MSAEFREELVSILPRLRRFAVTLTRDLHEADDLVQQACEKALLKQSQWEPGTRLDSWVYRIIQNLHIDALRSRSRRGEQEPDFVLDEMSDTRNTDVPEREDMLSKLSRVIDQLPEEQRSVMLLVSVEEHSYREAAEILEVPIGTVMSRLSRARAKIMEMLDAPAAEAGGG
jgi:RNA polymerase sigma-70 factor (ECF subfamily)